MWAIYVADVAMIWQSSLPQTSKSWNSLFCLASVSRDSDFRTGFRWLWWGKLKCFKQCLLFPAEMEHKGRGSVIVNGGQPAAHSLTRQNQESSNVISKLFPLTNELTKSSTALFSKVVYFSQTVWNLPEILIWIFLRG